MTMTLFSSLLVFAVFAIGIVNAGTVSFPSLKVDPLLHHRVGMFAPDDAPFHTYNQSTVKIALDFEVMPSGSDTQHHTVTLALFHSSADWRVGHYNSETKQVDYCCTPALLKKGVCAQPHSVIVNTTGEASSAIEVRQPEFVGKKSIRETINIELSGIYYLYIINCNKFSASSTTLVVKGSVTWRNPTGFLSAETYPFLPFYGVLALAYLVLGLLWFGVSLRHWRKLLAIQNWIAGVIFLGMAESATLYFDALEYNNAGLPNSGAEVFGILMSTLKRTVSRVLVLVVAMGYGVVKPTLGTTRYKVSLLGMLYFIFSAGLMLAQSGNSDGEVSWASALFLIVPVSILDTGFYWWIFLSLLRTIAQLKARRQVVKLSMYQWLFNVLAVSALLSAVVVLYQVISFAVTNRDAQWRTTWIWPAFWQLLYFVVLLALAALWRATHNNTRYAYADVRGDGDDHEPLDVELEQPSGLAGVVLRHATDDTDIEAMVTDTKSPTQKSQQPPPASKNE